MFVDYLRNPWIIIAIIMVVLIGGSVWYSSHMSNVANEGVIVNNYIKGNPDATVTLVKYSDFQCPACAQAASVVRDVLLSYGDQISFEYKHYPLIQIHPHAESAARAVEAAGQQGKFYEFHDLLFTNQAEWSRSGTPGVFFVRYAEELGLDVKLFKQHQKSSLLRDKVRNQLQESREKGLQRTPTFFLNGELLTFSTYTEFVEKIENAINEASGANSVDGQLPQVQFGI
jgi:protein-disulfide isomerase